MSKNYHQLSLSEQKDIIITSANKMAKNPVIIEKDIWLVWALDKLFSMENKLPIAFKGGTSLSKIFNIIERFSEDVDITIDYRAFELEKDPLSSDISKSQIKKISAQLKDCVSDYLQNIIKPYLESASRKEFPGMDVVITLEDGEKIYIEYPSVANTGASRYIKNRILVEFGGRNVIVPSAMHSIVSDISSHVDTINFPTAKVIALSPERTFWEKATLIHVACKRNPTDLGRGHQFRHWYDLAMLYSNSIGNTAIKNTALLNEVVRLKKVFFNAPYASYDECVTNKIKLVPEEAMLSMLHEDYQEMIAEKMFYNNALSFDQIINVIQVIEDNINTSI